MRTEQSLREALEFLAERAEQTQQTEQPEATRTPVRRLRRSLVLATVAAAVAAAVLVPVGLDRKGSPPPVTEKTTPPTKWIQQVMYAQSGRITRTYSGPNRTSCDVTEFPVDSFDPAKRGKLRKKTTVNGHPADLLETALTTPQRTHLLIAWRYRTGRWALATCARADDAPEDLGEAERRVQSFAESVAFGTSQLAPVDLGYLPPGARIQSIRATADSISIGVDGRSTDSIDVALSWPSQTRVLAGERPVQINGRPARVGINGLVRIPYGTFDLVVRVLSTATYAKRQSMAMAVAKEIHVADPKDRSSWFPAEVGLSPK